MDIYCTYMIKWLYTSCNFLIKFLFSTVPFYFPLYLISKSLFKSPHKGPSGRWVHPSRRIIYSIRNLVISLFTNIWIFILFKIFFISLLSLPFFSALSLSSVFNISLQLSRRLLHGKLDTDLIGFLHATLLVRSLSHVVWVSRTPPFLKPCKLLDFLLGIPTSHDSPRHRV